MSDTNPEDELPPQSLMQKQMLFASNPDMVEAVIEILKNSFQARELIGDSEYETIVNAVRFDTQQSVMVEFVKRIDFIKQGGLLNSQRS